MCFKILLVVTFLSVFCMTGLLMKIDDLEEVIIQKNNQLDIFRDKYQEYNLG